MTRRPREEGVAEAESGPEVIRRLGFNERYQLAMYTLDQYRGTVISCLYTAPSSLGSMSLEHLKSRVLDAIARVVLAQPHLQVGIIGEESNHPEFVRLDRLDLRHHVDWKSFDDAHDAQSHYRESLQSQLDARYADLSARPGWRVIALHETVTNSINMLYVWNHPHHDGMGGKIFHEQLLRNLNAWSAQSQAPSYTCHDGIINLGDSCSSTLSPPPEVLSPWPMTLSFQLKALWKELKPYQIFPPSTRHATWAPIRASPFATRFHNFTVDDDTLAKVVRTCRQHNTTLTGLIHALVLLSLCSTLGDMKGFASGTPYDLRRFLPSNTAEYPGLQPEQLMCNYVSMIDHEFGPELVAVMRSKMQRSSSAGMSTILSPDIMDIVWAVSARIRGEIKTKLNLATRNDMIGIMKFVLDWRNEQRSKARKPRHLSWLVTNVGILDGKVDKAQEHQQGWSVRRGELVLSAEVPAAAISVSVMTVKGEEMCVTGSWQDCVVDPSLGEQLMVDLERWLCEIAS